MDQSALNGFDFSLLVPALTAGLRDSINPCNFASILMLIIILSRIAHTPLHIILFGGLFIGLTGGVQMLSVMGFWDPLLTYPIILDVVRMGYLLVATAFLFLGTVHILDWWRYKEKHDTACFKLKLPVFFQSKGGSHPSKWWQKVFTIARKIITIGFAAVIMSFIGAVYPQSEYMFIVHSFFVAGGDRGFALQSFGLHSIAMVLPMIVAWIVIIFLALWKDRGAKIISYYKGILAALLVSTSIGIGYFFLN